MRFILLNLLLLIGFSLSSQNVRTLDPVQIESVPGEILIKLKDEVEPGINIQNGIIQSYDSLTILDRIGLKDKVFSSKILFSIKTRKYKTPRYQTGTVSKDKYNLNNLMKVKLKEEFYRDKEKLIEELNNNKEVEYAEPNYIYYAIGAEPVTDVMSEEEAKRWVEENYGEMDGPVVPNDPLYSSQSNIKAINADDVWETTKGDTTSVIAILDTGVDTEHPDLKDNIWTNHKEKSGTDEYDDDENGYKDDRHGWDFINNDSIPEDNNMHGTHVAGIAAAVGDNGKGIAGASWYSKIMPVKVLQASGRGDAGIISQGIEYAYQNGATILNMSFGGYAESQTMSRAAENAYAYATLVAAAGNDGKCIGPGIGCARMFPAAWTYVIGVEAGTKWSNYDQDGPTFSRWLNQENYEVKAPGTAIMSTVPNGGYRALSGTSMSSPLVAGAVALYNNQKPDDSKELLFGNLINTSSQWIDIKEAIDVVPVPMLKMLTAEVQDTAAANYYKDGQLDVGEFIEMYPKVKNYWGATDSVYVQVKIGGNEFQNAYWKTLVELKDSIQYLGSVSEYGMLYINERPLTFQLSENITHNTYLDFVLLTWSITDGEKISLDSITTTLQVKNAVKLQGIIEKDTVFKAGEYILTNSLILRGNINVTFKPGSTIKWGQDDLTMRYGKISQYSVEQKDTVWYTDNPESCPTCYSTYTNRYYPKFHLIGTKDSVITLMNDTYVDPWRQNPRISAQNDQRNGSWSHDIMTPTIPVTRENIDSLLSSPGQYLNGVCKWCVIKSDGFLSGFFVDKSLFYSETTMNAGTSSSIVKHSNYYNTRAGMGSPNRWPVGRYAPTRNNDFENTYFYDSYQDSAKWSRFNNYIEPEGESYYDWQTGYVSGGYIYAEGEVNVLGGYVQWNNWIGGQNYLYRKLVGLSAYQFEEFRTVYIGTGSTDVMKKMNYDEFDGGSGVWSYTNPRRTPYAEAPGIVWKILVDGKDAQDEYDDMDPIGVGKHKFEVYFNKPMDTLYTPQVSMGVRLPYNQTIFTEEGDWSSDSTVYTIYHTVGINAKDGINFIRVQDAKDTDGFEIPVEDRRFNMLVQAAGSLSTLFFAEPGLGKVDLKWDETEEEQLADVLGYNMYRYEAITDSTYSPTKQINTSLITDSTYTDYEVEPGKQYFYKFTTLRTNFTETDTSKTVSTTPLTADLGDANGDFEVDILDVIHQINYILGSSPQPFIMDAADVNNDGAVNVLDVVGTVNLILNPVGGNFYNPGEINYISQEPLGEAELFWRGDTLFVDSPIPLAGLQLSFDYDLDYTLLDAVDGFESMGYAQDDEKVLMLYSLSGKKISSGITPILTKTEPGEVHVTKAVFSNIEGRSVTANYMGYVLEEIEAKKQSSTIFSVGYPNPTSGRYILEYHIPEQVEGVGLVVYDMSGKVIQADGGLKNTSGRHRVEIDLSTKEDGIYIVVLSIGNKGYLLKQDVKRIVKE